jgi:aconitate hydratase
MLAKPKLKLGNRIVHNSSYEDIFASSIIGETCCRKEPENQSEFTFTPGSEQVRYTIERDGYIDIFHKIGANVFANACGPCIRSVNRPGAEKGEKKHDRTFV